MTARCSPRPSQPSPRSGGLAGTTAEPKFGVEAGGGDQEDDSKRKVVDDPTEKEGRMIPLYYEPQFTFRFADDRIIPRFHLEGIEAGRCVSVFRLDPVTGERLNRIASATAGMGGWVDLSEPIMVRSGDGFVAVPEKGT